MNNKQEAMLLQRVTHRIEFKFQKCKRKIVCFKLHAPTQEPAHRFVPHFILSFAVCTIVEHMDLYNKIIYSNPGVFVLGMTLNCIWW